MSKWTSFAQGYGLGQRMAEDYGRAKKKREIEKIANAKPEEMQGFTTDDADQLRSAAESGQYDIGIKTDERGGFKGYTVTPKSDPNQTGTIAVQGVTDFMGMRTPGRMTEDQIDRARQLAMAGVLTKYDPQEGMRMRREIKGQEREDLRFGREQQNWQIQDEERQREVEYRTGREQLLQNSPVGRAQAATTKYEQDMAAYNAAVAAGKSPQEMGLPPQRPNVERPGPMQTLAGYADLIAHDFKYGKLNTDGLIKFQEKMQNLEQENYTRALLIAQNGGSPDQIAKAFNASGAQIDPKNISVTRAPQPNGPELVTLGYKDANGRTVSLNVMAELEAYDKAKSVYDRFYQGEQNRRGNEQLQLSQNADRRAGAQFAQGQADRERTQADATARADAAVALFRENNPNASPAQLEAVRRGVIDAVPRADGNAPSEVRLAQALVNAGVEPDMAAALRRALSSKEKTPAEIRADIYGKALTTNMGNAGAAQKATEAAMAYLFPGGAAPTDGAGGSRAATGRVQDVPKVNSPEDLAKLPKGARYEAPDGSIRIKQ
jgi:hypothetical protein